MGKINVLSFAVANLIAAGEVVDRPASVIKELMENAIDAGAKHITVEIRNGGITFMRVADDGCGISPEDLPVAVRRHATSKIKDASDLDGILTLGFRGEALAAIAAVSDLRILTRTPDAAYGSMLTSRAGETVDVVEQGAPVGTTVIVENLFGNVPARRKFLKKDVAEGIAVSTYVEKIALSRPDIAIRLIVDGNMRLETAGDGELKNAIYAVFGKDFASRMIPVEGGSEGVHVHGFIGRSDNVRPKRNYENFFINGRYINSRTAAAALEQAYTSYIPPEKFPCCVLYIDINPAAVDVNVHPAKLEVKFSNEKPVFEAVYYAVRTALEANVQRPEIKLAPPTPSALGAFVPIEEGKRESLAKRQISINTPAPVKEESFTRMSAADYAARYTGRAAAAVPFYKNGEQRPREEGIPIPVSPALKQAVSKEHEQPISPKTVSVPPSAPPSAPVPEAPTRAEGATAPTTPTPDVAPWRIVGEVFHSFIVVEAGEKMLLIDKHAAHERILFEDLRKRLSDREEASQLLLIPLQLSLSREDADTLALFADEVSAIGFTYEANGLSLSVSEIPEGLTPAAATELLLTLAQSLREGTGNAKLSRDIIFEKALYQGACKAAIKAGRDYPPEYIEQLCLRLSQMEDITVCPHGRPVAMVLTHAAIDRQFGRG